MNLFTFVLLVIALACFLLSAFGVPSRVSWSDLGRACLVGAVLVYVGSPI